MGFIGYTAKASHSWVSQAIQPSQLTVGFHRLHTINPTFTLRTSQANKWDYLATQPSHLTTGFIRLLSQSIIQIWVYQVVHTRITHMAKMHKKTHPSQLPIGFIRLLNQANIQLGFTGFPAKPIYNWVSQAVIQ